MARAKFSFSFLVSALILVIVMDLFGHMTPLRSFVSADGRASDFLKIILAIPGPPLAPGPFADLVAHYLASPDYRVDKGVTHLPPFTMFISLLLRNLFEWISPAIVYLACVGAFLAALLLTVRYQTGNFYWALTTLVSYPTLIIIDRGNLYAGLAGVCVVTALIRKKPDWIAALLFAVAINIRPNIALAVFPLLLLEWHFALRFGAVTVLTFFASLVSAHAMLSGYTLVDFASALQEYSKMYGNEGFGVALGSSLYGGLYALGFSNAYMVATIVALIPLPAAIYAFHQRRLSYDAMTFVAVASTALATPVFGDYHLIAFLAPMILAQSRIVAWASLLLLAPKGYWALGDHTVQVVINPAIMLGATYFIVLSAIQWRIRSPQPQ